MEILDFRNYQMIDEKTDKDLYEALSNENKDLAKKYVRVRIMGKLQRTVTVILHKELVQCLELLLKYRQKMEVPENNPYVFGIPSGMKKEITYLRACALMRKYSEECGAVHPERLRATQLRKHIATICINLNLQEEEVSDLANFMGHHENIHKQIYRQPVMNREILNVSRLLEAAQGENSDIETSDAESNMEEELITRRLNNTPSSKPTTSRKRNTPPYGSVIRRRWSVTEKKIISEIFRKNIEEQRLPSFNEISDAVGKHAELSERSIPQIKTWIHNQITKIKKSD
ncbi:hypothetical protein HHI36_024421 [Cryptolaemus montrouzieri]|uniref:Uncharacterized protein n=1 Tax=Cryptolaemus montrouzieri TaxID=559131 RepID=A0ABD2NCN5_9CUCU